MHCAIIGDSIAVGLHFFMPQCTLAARSGISSNGYVTHYTNKITADLTVISLGSNDGFFAYHALLKERERIITGKVVWILPHNNLGAKRGITAIANKFQDRVISISSTKDGVHPTNSQYKIIADSLEN